MNFVQNFPAISILLCLFAGIISSGLKRKAARGLSRALLIAELFLNGSTLLYVLGTGEAFVYVMGKFPAPWGNEIRAGVLEALVALFFCIIMLLSLEGGVKKLADEGFEVELLPVGTLGTVTAQQVSEAIREDTALATIMYANNEIGSILTVSEIGAVCRERRVIFHTDAVQAAGHLPIDVRAQNIDLLSLSAHKFHGPKGIGVLYARQGVPLTSLIEGGAQERGKRAGTENVSAVAGMAAALEESCAHMAENAAKVSVLRDRLIAGLSQIPHSALNGDPVNRLPGNVNFCFEGIEGESLLLLLDDRGICASSGSACTSGSLDPSHVLLAIGRPHEVAHGSLRLSLCEENTEADVDAILKAVPEIVAYLRNMSPLWKDKVSGKKEFVL